jgi:hypothetical protein
MRERFWSINSSFIVQDDSRESQGASDSTENPHVISHDWDFTVEDRLYHSPPQISIPGHLRHSLWKCPRRTFCAPRRPSMSAKAGKSERPLCKTCSNISLQELATDRGVILPHRWDHLRENPESCPLCEAVSGAIRIGNPAKPRLVIRAIPGGASPAGSPLRFLVLGLSKSCP